MTYISCQLGSTCTECITAWCILFISVVWCPLQVFEVNASHRRSGKQVLQQLQEATQSHQVTNKNLSDVFSTILSGESVSKCDHPLNAPAALTIANRVLLCTIIVQHSHHKSCLVPCHSVEHSATCSCCYRTETRGKGGANTEEMQEEVDVSGVQAPVRWSSQAVVGSSRGRCGAEYRKR